MTINTNTIAALLTTARQQLQAASDSAVIDAELLLAHCINQSRTYLYTWPEHTPEPAAVEQFRRFVNERCNGIPLAYLTGHREFWSLDFKVTRDTLIPRADTELLVQLAVESLQLTPGPVLDLGTGSGAIAVSIAHELPSIRVDAVDQSEAALEVARYNAIHNNVQVQFQQSDWFANVTQSDYRLIVSNPPYIAEHDPHLAKGGLQYEPIQALRAADNGFAAIKHLITNAPNYCDDGAWLMIEHGHEQGTGTRELMHQHGYRNIQTHRDIEQRERVTVGQPTQQGAANA